MFKKVLALSFLIIFLAVRSLACHFYKDWQQTQTGMQISPANNPGMYTITYKSEGQGPVSIMVFDALGKYVVLKNVRDFNGELKETVDLSSMPKGIYIFELEGNNFREAKKVIFQ